MSAWRYKHTKRGSRALSCGLASVFAGAAAFLLASAGAAKLMIETNSSGAAAGPAAWTALGCGAWMTAWMSTRILGRGLLPCTGASLVIFGVLPLGSAWILAGPVPAWEIVVRIAAITGSSLLGAVMGMHRAEKRKKVS